MVSALFAKSYPLAAVAGGALLLRTIRSTKRALKGYHADLLYVAEAFLYCLLAPFVHIGMHVYGYLRFLPYHPVLRGKKR